jgi:hypothetical protein
LVNGIYNLLLEAVGEIIKIKEETNLGRILVEGK